MTEECKVKRAIIKALTNKIIEEALAEKDLKARLSQNVDDGSTGLEPTSKVVRYLIGKLAEKRYENGIAMKKDPEEW